MFCANTLISSPLSYWWTGVRSASLVTHNQKDSSFCFHHLHCPLTCLLAIFFSQNLKCYANEKDTIEYDTDGSPIIKLNETTSSDNSCHWWKAIKHDSMGSNACRSNCILLNSISSPRMLFRPMTRCCSSDIIWNLLEFTMMCWGIGQAIKGTWSHQQYRTAKFIYHSLPHWSGCIVLYPTHI